MMKTLQPYFVSFGVFLFWVAFLGFIPSQVWADLQAESTPMTSTPNLYPSHLQLEPDNFIDQGFDDLPTVSKISEHPDFFAEIWPRQMVLLRYLRNNKETLDHPIANNYLSQLNQLLLGQTAIGDDKKAFSQSLIIKDSQVNALAGGLGVLGINTGLILLTDQEDQLAAVIAHEVAHLSQDHLFRSVLQSRQNKVIGSLGLLGTLILAPMNSDISDAVLRGAWGLARQNSLSFSRQAEWEADQLGMQLLVQAGYSASAMVDFLVILDRAKMPSVKAELNFLNTHPLTEERISQARARAASFKTPQSSSLNAQEDYFFFQALIANLAEKTELLDQPLALEFSELLALSDDWKRWYKVGRFTQKQLPQLKAQNERLKSWVERFDESKVIRYFWLQNSLAITSVLALDLSQNREDFQNRIALIKKELNVLKTLYPNEWPLIMFEGLIYEQTGQSEQAFHTLLNVAKTQQDISSARLAFQIANQKEWKAHTHWANAVASEINVELSRARNYYELAIDAFEQDITAHQSQKVPNPSLQKDYFQALNDKENLERMIKKLQKG